MAPAVLAMTEVVEITGIAAGGAGVGRLADGRAVFVHRTAPGEAVEVRVTERKRRWARARLESVRRAAPERRDAPCRYYDRCGGCTLEHLAYPAQLRAKGRLVTDALRRIGHVAADEPHVGASPSEFRYRNRVSFTLLRLGEGRVVAGFHELERPGRVVDIDADCLLPEPALAEAWGALRRAWGDGAHRLPAGQKLRLTLRAAATGAVTLLVDGGTSPGRPTELLESVPALAAIWQRRRAGAEPELLAGASAVEDRWSDETVRLGGAVFLQVNREAAAALEDHVAELAAPVAAAGGRVVDAYCGVGLLARRLARAGARVDGIELETLAVAEARRGAPPGAAFHAGRVEELLPGLLPAELVVVNPPRTGLDPAVTDALAARPAPVVIYVSCDPATLARDLGRLRERYRIESLRCFDLFPQTAHVETVAALSAREGAAGGAGTDGRRDVTSSPPEP